MTQPDCKSDVWHSQLPLEHLQIVDGEQVYSESEQIPSEFFLGSLIMSKAQARPSAVQLPEGVAAGQDSRDRSKPRRLLLAETAEKKKKKRAMDRTKDMVAVCFTLLVWSG